MEANSMLVFYLEGYKDLLANAKKFPLNLGTTAPDEILAQSKRLQQQQLELRKHDALMLQALKESDHDSIDWDKVRECQELIQDVVDIFDTISMKAHTQKAILAEELKKVGKGISSLRSYSTAQEQSGVLLKRSF